MSNLMILNETSYFGKGAIESIVPEFQQRGFSKAAVITDKGLIEHGIATKVTELLDNAGIDYVLYDGIVPNPTIQNVKDGVAFVKEAEADCLIAIGGGRQSIRQKPLGLF